MKLPTLPQSPCWQPTLFPLLHYPARQKRERPFKQTFSPTPSYDQPILREEWSGYFPECDGVREGAIWYLSCVKCLPALKSSQWHMAHRKENRSSSKSWTRQNKYKYTKNRVERKGRRRNNHGSAPNLTLPCPIEEWPVREQIHEIQTVVDLEHSRTSWLWTEKNVMLKVMFL